MIVPMTKVRVLGPRDRLKSTLLALQDLGTMQLDTPPASADLHPVTPGRRELRRRSQVGRILSDADEALRLLQADARQEPAQRVPDGDTLCRWARVCGRAARQARGLDACLRALDDERALIGQYQGFLRVILPWVTQVATVPGLVSHALVLPAGSRGVLDELAATVGGQDRDRIAITTRALPRGDLAVLLALPMALDQRLERALAEARIPEVALPAAYADRPLAEAVPRLLERLSAIPRESEALRRERAVLARQHGSDLRRARAGCHDWLAEAAARDQAAVTARAFALDGWVPDRAVPVLRQRLQQTLGTEVVVEPLGRAEWRGEDAPVVLRNPALFRPFEVLLRVFPLPRYGSIDPTPFVAVFFPMIFGMILGDVGYGLLLAALAAYGLTRRGSGSRLRTAARIAAPCAVFAVVFGVLYGELFGDLGRRWLGLHAVWFSREEAVLAALGVAVALGVVHVVLGLVLGVVSRRHEPRHALGQGLSGVMVLLVVVALLAAADALPSRLFTPAVIALLACFPLLVLLEGMIAPVELLATLGNVLSYARIMALGTASVMLAVVANQMVGAIGSAVVGVLFALLFHLVNFAIGLFSPAIHALRLHYVEFFGKFYSPGGQPYRPLGHWSPSGPVPARRSS